eukprot:62643-Pelagomonas_calceolata.AAC.1
MLPAQDFEDDMVIAEDGIASLSCTQFSSLILLIIPEPLGSVRYWISAPSGPLDPDLWGLCGFQGQGLCEGCQEGVATNHATKDGYTRAVGWSCECTGLHLLHVAAKLLL